MNIVKHLADQGAAHPPSWLPDNLHLLVLMGSYAYGINNDLSDCDLYGFAIPQKDVLFPHLGGGILGFAELKHGGNRFTNYQEHHIHDPKAIKDGKEDRSYDLSIYNIVDYFQLVMENNPNMLDSLYVPQDCIWHITKIGQMVRDNRKLFMTKNVWHTFKGYSYAQLKKAKSKERTGKRAEVVEKYGYDLKFAAHVVRLMSEVEQILVEGDLDLRRNNEQLKSIRRGEWKIEQIEEHFARKEADLETAYANSKLPWGWKEPGVGDRIRQLLMQCLEEHYGSLTECVRNVTAADTALKSIGDIVDSYKKSLN